MEQLLEYRRIPISMEYQITNAKYEPTSPQPSYEASREQGGFEIKSKPIKVRLDSYEARASIGLKSVSRSVSEAAQDGIKAAHEATANYAEEGNMLMDTRPSSNAFANVMANRTNKSLDSMMAFLPSSPAEISWDANELFMQYQADKLNFDWRISYKPDVQFTPANIKFIIKEYPRLEITYKGKPLYIPPSADPEYEPVVLNARA